jgi:signal peptidase II
MERIPRSRYVLFAILAALGCFLDLATKHWVFSWSTLHSGSVSWLWDGYAGIQATLNEGALFGMGQGLAWLFAGISILAAIAIPIWLFRFGAARDLWLTVALGGVMAGVLGNLYDRLGMPGLVWPAAHPRAGESVYAVRDWILLQWNDQLRWPNFNLADSFLVVGACLLVLHSMWLSEPASEQSSPAAAGKRPREDGCPT